MTVSGYCQVQLYKIDTFNVYNWTVCIFLSRCVQCVRSVGQFPIGLVCGLWQCLGIVDVRSKCTHCSAEIENWILYCPCWSSGRETCPIRKQPKTLMSSTWGTCTHSSLHRNKCGLVVSSIMLSSILYISGRSILQNSLWKLPNPRTWGFQLGGHSSLMQIYYTTVYCWYRNERLQYWQQPQLTKMNLPVKCIW